ncbi:MAG TPA: response regulator [Caulobacteraceae bacterium]|jgi:CheY-like chemotaxis protein
MNDSDLRPRVLVVEDEWLIANVLEAMLEDMGCRVLGPAPAVAPAVDLIDRSPPDAALLDVSLGRSKSFPVAEALQRQGIPFLFLTGYQETNLDPPFDHCAVLSKPVSEAGLRRAVTALLAKGRPPLALA